YCARRAYSTNYVMDF
nr:immunoglobulin heavy chain junction region [Mus musculus]